MEIERFKALIDAYGAAVARWPADEREAALSFAETDAEARRLLQDEAALDRLLDAADTLPATRALEDRILAAFPERPPQTRRRWLAALAEHWIPSAAIACSLALGLLLGAALPGLVGIGETGVDPAQIALGGFDADPLSELGDGT
jgi:hypothetical protein